MAITHIHYGKQSDINGIWLYNKMEGKTNPKLSSMTTVNYYYDNCYRKHYTIVW